MLEEMASCSKGSRGGGKNKKVQHSKELLEIPSGPDILELGRAGRSGRRKGKKVTSKPPKTFKVENSSVLSRVRSFLPEMEKADKELRDLLRDDQTREQLDMERTPEEGPCIEMNMALVPADEYSSSESDEDSNDSSPAAPHYRPTIVAEGTLEEVGVGDTEGLLASEALPGLYLPQSKRVGTSKCKLIEEVT